MDRVSKNDLINKCQNDFISKYGDQKFSTAIAPGRINIIGEHTDYNQGLAMPIAIDRWIISVVSVREDEKIDIYSSNFNERVFLNLNQLDDGIKWQKYVFGCIKIILSEYKIKKGLNILISGNIPIGFGMSSSAALEVSLLSSLMNVFKIPINYNRLLELSNRLENSFLGINSGMLDQYASIFSKKNKPLLIDFSQLSHTYVDSKIVGASWFLVNSMIDRSLIDSKYNERVSECKKALKDVNNKCNTVLKINDIKISHLNEFKKARGEQISYNRLKHIISENRRVKLMKEAISSGNLDLVGKILNDSHNSLDKDYEVSCKEINSIIEFSKYEEGFIGGRIMGGGFGGCCIMLIDDCKKKIFEKNLIKNFYDIYKYEIKIEIVNFSNGLEII